MRQSSADSLLLLAYLFVEHKKFDKALTLLLGLNEIFPDDERILRPLGYTLLMEKRHQEAQGIFSQLLRLYSTRKNEDYACVLRLQAEAFWGMGKKKEASAALEHSIEILHSAAAPVQI